MNNHGEQVPKNHQERHDECSHDLNNTKIQKLRELILACISRYISSLSDNCDNRIPLNQDSLGIFFPKGCSICVDCTQNSETIDFTISSTRSTIQWSIQGSFPFQSTDVEIKKIIFDVLDAECPPMNPIAALNRGGWEKVSVPRILLATIELPSVSGCKNVDEHWLPLLHMRGNRVIRRIEYVFNNVGKYNWRKNNVQTLRRIMDDAQNLKDRTFAYGYTQNEQGQYVLIVYFLEPDRTMPFTAMMQMQFPDVYTSFLRDVDVSSRMPMLLLEEITVPIHPETALPNKKDIEYCATVSEHFMKKNGCIAEISDLGESSEIVYRILQYADAYRNEHRITAYPLPSNYKDVFITLLDSNGGTMEIRDCSVANEQRYSIYLSTIKNNQIKTAFLLQLIQGRVPTEEDRQGAIEYVRELTQPPQNAADALLQYLRLMDPQFSINSIISLPYKTADTEDDEIDPIDLDTCRNMLGNAGWEIVDESCHQLQRCHTNRWIAANKESLDAANQYILDAGSGIDVRTAIWTNSGQEEGLHTLHLLRLQKDPVMAVYKRIKKMYRDSNITVILCEQPLPEHAELSARIRYNRGKVDIKALQYIRTVVNNLHQASSCSIFVASDCTNEGVLVRVVWES